MGEVLRLRRHQEEAVPALIDGLYGSRNGDLPARGLRGQLLSAPGTGKTVSAAVAALKLAPRGLTGVLVPTLDLLTQTVQSWRRAGHRAPGVAVCHLGTDPLLESLDVRCTTNPTQLALWTRDQPALVFATNASLSPQGLADDQDETELALSVLEEAMRGTYGQRLRPFDLLVIDEAHHFAGDLDRAWTAVHDQDRIPAARRLYMTATPRLWDTSATATGGLARPIASMNDPAIFGPVLHDLGLMEAVEKAILARFEVDVLEIRDPEPPGSTASREEIRGRRLAALQAALLKYTDLTGVRSLMTYHTLTAEAMAFARALPATAAELHESDPATYPKRVHADWLSGEHPAEHRRTVLSRFADGLDHEGWVSDVSFLSSCQVLGEGVDIRGRRGVDAVVFADTRQSTVQIIQIIGRALRQEPEEGKVARIVVPVFLEPGEDPDHMVSSPSYRPLVAVLQGLRAYDENILERMLPQRTTQRGASTPTLNLDPQAEPAAAGPKAAEDTPATEDTDEEQAAGTQHSGAAATTDVPLLHFSLPRNPDVLAAFLRTRVLQPDSAVWLQGFECFREWADHHGHAQIPIDTVVDLPGGGTYPLGAWNSEQRRAFVEGTIKAWRAELLDDYGMIWSVADAAFWKKLPAARRYYATFGTLAAPRSAVIENVPVGQWLAHLRKPGGLGTDPERARLRRDALTAIDPYWNPDWPVEWQRHYAAARTLLSEETGPVTVFPGLTVHGTDVGRWLHHQTDPKIWNTLMPGQTELLTQLGLGPRTQTTPPASPALPAPSPRPALTAAETVSAPAPRTSATPTPTPSKGFPRGIAALRQYSARTGRLSPPRAEVETMPDGATVAVGVWLSNTKARRAKLTAQQRAELVELGHEWAAEEGAAR
ncbi:Helicase associated domain protein [Streptomyces albidoflavus]|uniref:DEAD/DEAH box helicase n=1 Tax=Streptomyces albidoflavus TaxID=1886 RepID=UPI0033C38DC4